MTPGKDGGPVGKRVAGRGPPWAGCPRHRSCPALCHGQACFKPPGPIYAKEETNTQHAVIDPSHAKSLCSSGVSADTSTHILLNQITLFTLFLPAESPCVARGRFVRRD